MKTQTKSFRDRGKFRRVNLDTPTCEFFLGIQVRVAISRARLTRGGGRSESGHYGQHSVPWKNVIIPDWLRVKIAELTKTNRTAAISLL